VVHDHKAWKALARNKESLTSPDSWDSVYSSEKVFFGEPSELAKEAVPFFKENKTKAILELGCGQGRDALFLARSRFRVHALNRSEIAISQLRKGMAKVGMSESQIKFSCADIPKKLPQIEKGEFDAVYSHLFLCMPFEDQELNNIFDFVQDILPQGGLHIFSIRNKNKDKSFGKGKEIAKDTFEINGFKVRYFTEDEILEFNRRFRTLEVKETYEEPCSLILVFSMRKL
jgi:SAM-dependent methyltransferase